MPPAQYPQAIQVGRLLANSRHQITVVSAFDTNIETSLKRIVVPTTAVRWPLAHRVALRLLPFYGAAPDEYSDWIARAEKEILTAINSELTQPDVVISFGEPMSDHLLGKKIAKHLRLPWVAHFSDPWADNPFRRRSKLSYRRNVKLEASVVKGATRLIFTANATRQLFADKYGLLEARKMHVLPHSFEPSLYPDREPASEGQIVARYLGNFYGRRTPFPLLRAVKRMQQADPNLHHRLRIEFIGAMPGWLAHHPLIRRAPAEIVRFLPPVDYQTSLKRMVDSNLLLVIDAPAQASPFLPSKLIDYLGAARPILGITPPGPCADLLELVGDPVADPSDPQAIANALAGIISNYQVRLAASAARQTHSARYEAPRVAAEFDELIDGIAEGNTAEAARS